MLENPAGLLVVALPKRKTVATLLEALLRTIPATFELTVRGLTIGYDDAPTRHKLPGRSYPTVRHRQELPPDNSINKLILLIFAIWHGFCSVNGELVGLGRLAGSGTEPGIRAMENAQLIGLSRQIALQRQMDVVANNMANLNTTGFKAEQLLFEEYKMPVAKVRPFEDALLSTLRSRHKDLLDSIAASKDLSDENAGKLKSVVESVAKSIA